MNQTGLKSGYSLIEISFGLCLIALLVLSGSSFFFNNQKHQLQVAVRKISSSLAVARFRSVNRQVPVRVILRNNFCELAEYDPQSSDWRVTNRDFLEGVEVTANNSPVFYPQGTVSNLATIKITNGGGCYQITIAITGRIKTTKLN
jgi:Tfp pilus assembly protein FimT